MAFHETIVVGAGPAGLLYSLGSKRDTLVLEARRRVGRPPHCTGLVSASTARLMPRDPIITEFDSIRVFVGRLEAEVHVKLVWIDRPRLEDTLQGG